MAVLCFVFLRTTALAIEGAESSIKGCSEIFNVCFSGEPSVLLESKSHKVSRIDAPPDARICLSVLDEPIRQTRSQQSFHRSHTPVCKLPLWLINQKLLI